MIKRLMFRFLFLLLLFLSFNSLSAQIDHWETAVNFNDTWKYWPGTAEPSPNWRMNTFNDAAWTSGVGGVGFGDADDNTIIAQVPSVYLRRSFTVTDTSAIKQALLSIDYDDGFIAYLNNVEICRSNLGAVTGDLPPFGQYANGQHEAMMYQGGSAESFIITKAKLNQCLVPGNNVLAVTVHNATAASADLSSLTWLHFGIGNTNTYFGGNPVWFTPPITSSNLPLVVLDTRGGTIGDSIRIVADMGIIDNGPGNRNYLSDPFNDYDGLISIEIRGSTSQQYPKKSYGVETQDSLGNNLNVPILGMPAENDWVLYAPYPDKTLMRNTLAYDLFRKMMHYSPQTRFCEVILNGQYIGVYEFHERIKIDRGRLDLPKLDSADLAGDSLTGGYVIKVDKQTGTGSNNWTSPLNGNVFFQFHDPEELELMPAQSAYIQDFVSDFEVALNGANFADPLVGYRRYIDVNSFMDFQIMQEMGRTVDGYRSSSFMHKQRDSYGGKLSAGPMWDFNLSFGNADYCDAFVTAGWQYEFNTVCPGYSPEVPFWWTKLMTDTRYRNEISCRWNDLRDGPLHTDTVMAWIDTVATLLDESQQRNFVRWPILGQYVNWNAYVGIDYADDLAWLKSWVTQRLAWLDTGWPVQPPSCNSIGAGDIFISEVNYNSSTAANSGDWIELHNLGSVAVDLGDWKLKTGNPDLLFTIPPGTLIPAGDYLVLVEDTAEFLSRHPLVTNFLGSFNFNLDNAGDAIHLYDAFYSPVVSMRFDDVAPWPTQADGFGYTLELVSLVANPSDGNNWMIVCPEGSPGELAFFPCAMGISNAVSPRPFTVFPNPFTNELTVRFETPVSAGTEILLTDLSGRLLVREVMNGGLSLKLDLGELPVGVYLVGGSEVGWKKVICSE